MQKRNRRAPFFALFDGPDPNASTARRDVTTVPTQALYFMNDPFVHARAEKFAARILAAEGDDGPRLDFACRQLFGRTASAEEHSEAAEFLRDYASACAGPPAEKRSILAWSAPGCCSRAMNCSMWTGKKRRRRSAPTVAHTSLRAGYAASLPRVGRRSQHEAGMLLDLHAMMQALRQRCR
jgi:hypothetical protein